MPELSQYAKPFLFFKLTQFVLGIVSFGLFFKFVLGTGDTNLAVREHIMVVAVVAYPFVVLPSVIAAFVFEPDIERSLASILLSFGGFLVSLIAGALVLNHSKAGEKAAGSFAVITSFVFLVDVILFGIGKYRR